MTREVGALAGSRGLSALSSWPTVERGGSGPAPCSVLSPLCASGPLHNGLRKLDRGQVIGLEIDNNKAGPICVWRPSRCYSGGYLGQTGWGEAAGGRCPSGILAVSEQTLVSSTGPSVTVMVLPPSISMLETTEGPCQANSRAHLPLLQNLCFALSPVEAKLSYCWRPVHRSRPLPCPDTHLSCLRAAALPRPVWAALVGCSGASCLRWSILGPLQYPTTFWFHCCVTCYKAGMPVMPTPVLQCLELSQSRQPSEHVCGETD